MSINSITGNTLLTSGSFPPVRAASTGSPLNPAVGGLVVVDGVQLIGGDRVLCKDEASAVNNGIYTASTGPWVRTTDASNNQQFFSGMAVTVALGAVNAGLTYICTTTDDPVVVGASLITFVAQSIVATATQSATSATSLTIGTGSKTLTIQTGKAFQVSQWVLIQETSIPANQMLGQVTAYAGTSLTVNVTATGGTGTHADWTIVLTNSPAAAGFQPPVGGGNVTGPGSSTAGHIATFADGTGKVIQDGGAPVGAANTLTPSMFAAAAISLGATMLNGTIVASVALNALTLAIKTLAGNDPSANDPVLFVFRSATASSGSYSVIELTAPLSTTVPMSSTLGFSNATPGRLWLVAINNAGAVSLAVINCLTIDAAHCTIFPLAGQLIANITAYGGGANSSQIFYGASSLSSVPYGVLGFVTREVGSTLATAGTWNATPTRIELYRPGVPLPGQEVQFQWNLTGTLGTGLGTFSANNTTPQNTNGDQYMTQVITPTSSANVLEVHAQGCFANSATQRQVMSIFQDANTNALSTGTGSLTTNVNGEIRTMHRLLAATLSPTTFKMRGGGGAAGTTSFNGEAGLQLYNGTFNSFMGVREIAA